MSDIEELQELANCIEADPAFNPHTNATVVSAMRNAAVELRSLRSVRAAVIEAAQGYLDAQQFIMERRWVPGSTDWAKFADAEEALRRALTGGPRD